MPSQMDIFTEAKARQEQLLKRLASAPPVDLLGVVDPGGATGSMFQGEERWTLKLKLEAWRIPGAEVQVSPLIVHRSVSKDELANFRGLITPYTVIRIRARVVPDAALGGSAALLEEFIRIENSDKDLNDYATQLQKPVNHEDPVLGTFTLDRRISCFTGHANWNGNQISLHLSAREPGEIEAALKTAHSLWKSQNEWDRRIREYAVKALLPLKNKNWLAEDENAVTPDEFERRMALESVTVHPDGSFEFWHRDGDLFWGHSIQISGNLSEGPTGADIPG